MNDSTFTLLHNEEAIPRSEIPQVSFADFRRTIFGAVAHGQRVAALFGDAATSADQVDLYAVLADSAQGQLRVGKVTLDASPR
jgi:hypothetical protein